jgi:uracil phosphoribosyltransferase
LSAAAANCVTIIAHPVVQHHLTVLRDRRTGPEEFRQRLAQAAALMVYEATRSLGTSPLGVRTPLAVARGVRLEKEVLLVPVLRAGLGMLDGILRLIPDARVGFIGLKRSEKTLHASSYHKSLPEELGSFEILLIDPMLATGGSIVAALGLLAARGARRVRVVSLVAAPEGIARVHKRYPELPIFTAAVDLRLNRKGYILPGLGDAGDRLFGV